VYYTVFTYFATNILFVFTLGWYLITNLQWYDYKIERVVLNHHKRHWHLLYFILPVLAYYFAGKLFIVLFFLLFLPATVIWYRRLDKKLVFTWRVKRFFILLFFLTLFLDTLCTLDKECDMYAVFIPLALTYILSTAAEKFLFLIYKREAKKRLASMQGLQIVCITGSYGKTSIKNFTAALLAKRYNVYATPRSVNTIGGIVRDINESLPADTEIYVCEAGARQMDDIRVIAEFLQPQTVVVGKVGPQHLEYFKTVANIVHAKLQVMRSDRLEKAFIHTSVTDEPHEKVTFFGENIEDVKADLQGTSFTLHVNEQTLPLHTKILGAFQTINIAAAVLVAMQLGVEEQEIIDAVEQLGAVEHRLQRIDAGGKIILDDGYNGNIDGMLEAIRLCSLHNGSKVIVTPGLVESSEELNLRLINAINNIFDTVIVTSALNAALFEKHLHVANKIILTDKTQLQNTLSIETKAGDIILFANDAPNFI
jgi:UDP-N-acetylmuramoyl-tripeptide--D-alanyl-D-alanine ligase